MRKTLGYHRWLAALQFAMCPLRLISLLFFQSPIRLSCCFRCLFKTCRLPIHGTPRTSLFRIDPTKWSLSSFSRSCYVSVTVRSNFLPATISPCQTSFVPDRQTSSVLSRPHLPHLDPLLVPHLKEDQVSQRDMSVVSQHVPPPAQKTQPSGRVCLWVIQ